MGRANNLRVLKNRPRREHNRSDKGLIIVMKLTCKKSGKRQKNKTYIVGFVEEEEEEHQNTNGQLK